MAETLLMLLKIFVVFATAGSLLELGLQLELRQTVVGLRWRCCCRGCSFSTNPTPSASS